jgi:hypothetical protein
MPVRAVVIVFGGVLTFTVCAIAWTLARERVRRRRMGEAASALGLSSVPDSRALMEQDGLSAVPLLALAALGAGVELTNAVKGRFEGLDLVVCDYRRTSGIPGQEIQHRQTLACVQIGERRLPEFVLEPTRGAVERMVVRRGLGLIGSVASRLAPSRAYRQAAGTLQEWAEDPGLMAGVDPDFSRRYRLLGTEQAGIRTLFGQRVLEFFGRQWDNPIAVQSAGAWLVIFRHDVLVNPGALRTFVQEAAFVVRLLVDDQHRS